MSLNYDILANILKYTSISDINNTVTILSNNLTKSDKQKLEENRKNPLCYLKQITDKPLELLSFMRHCRVILSGSRAADFFYPGAALEDSDWDFYCEFDLIAICIFSKYLESIGVKWLSVDEQNNITSNREQEYQDSSATISYVKEGILIKGNKQIHIQLIVCSKYISTFESIVKFHSSFIQCFISGYAAVSLYHSLSKKSMSLKWYKKREMECLIEFNNNADLTEKYQNRGIKYVSYEYWTLKGNFNNFDPYSTQTKIRRVSDSDTCVLPFYEYIKSTINNSDYNLMIALLNKITWIESPYMLVGKYQIRGEYFRGISPMRSLQYAIDKNILTISRYNYLNSGILPLKPFNTLYTKITNLFHNFIFNNIEEIYMEQLSNFSIDEIRKLAMNQHKSNSVYYFP